MEWDRTEDVAREAGRQADDVVVELEGLEGGEVSWAFLGGAGEKAPVVKVKVSAAERNFHSEASALRPLKAHGHAVPVLLHVEAHELALEHVVASRVS